jgi:GNAT superfamily N-acetyltransferase
MCEFASTPGNWPGLEFRGYHFKLADRPDEIDQIHRLVYRTFVLEIKQHPDAGGGRLVDKFHHKNRYLIAEREGQVCAMVAVHDRPPFSVADAIPTSGVLEGLVPRLLEVRLLAVEPGQRHRWLFGGLLWAVYGYAEQLGYQYLTISGLRERQGMYERMGFRLLGDPVPRGKAYFVPMLLRLSDLGERAQRTRDRLVRIIQAESSTCPAAGRPRPTGAATAARPENGLRGGGSC